MAQQVTSTSGSKSSELSTSMDSKSRMRQTSDKEFVGTRIQADYYMDQFIDSLRFQTGANADFKFCIGQISTSLFICLSQKVSLCMMKRLKSQDVYFQSGKIGHRSTRIQLRPWNRMNKFPTVEDNEPRKTHDDITRKYRMNAGSNVVTLFPPRSCFRVSICFVQ